MPDNKPPVPASQASQRFGLGESLGLGGLILGVVTLALTPPLGVKIFLLGVSGVLCFFFFRKSHWTYAWRPCRQYVFTGIVVCVLFGIGIPQFMSQWRSEHPKTSPSTAQPKVHEVGPEPTLKSLFKSDMGNYYKYTTDNNLFYQNNKDGKAHHVAIERQVYQDPDAKVDFIGFLIQGDDPNDGAATVFVCRWLVDQVKPTLEEMKRDIGVRWFNATRSGQITDVKDLTFSGRVFIYHDALLSMEQMVELRAAYKHRGMSLELRGPEFLAEEVLAWHKKNDSTAN